jgi:hypothetical protein
MILSGAAWRHFETSSSGPAVTGYTMLKRSSAARVARSSSSSSAAAEIGAGQLTTRSAHRSRRVQPQVQEWLIAGANLRRRMTVRRHGMGVQVHVDDGEPFLRLGRRRDDAE